MDANSNLPAENPATNLIKQFIVGHYRPAMDYTKADVKISTVQLHQKLLVMFPEADITVAGLCKFLGDQGYKEVEVRPFMSEWIFARID